MGKKPQVGSLAVLLLMVVTVLFAWLHGLTAITPWGDDWAGYLLQAKAIVAGEVDAELAMNTRAMRGGDVQIGPYAYPWGYPVLLAVAGVASGWSTLGLKLVGGLSLLLLVLSAFALARLRLALGLSAVVALAVGLQPDLVVDANFLGSDVPFAAFSTVGLLCVYAQYVLLAERRAASLWLATGVVLMSIVAFSIRSNGAVLPSTYVASLGLMVLRDRDRWRPLIGHAVGFCAVVLALYAAYFAAFPDGSLVHASYLSIDPHVWLERGIRHIHYLAEWVTFRRILGVAKLVPLGILMAGIAWGLVRRPWDGAVLLIYVVLHLGLLTLFPFDGGLRYYHPLLPPAFMLFAMGWEEFWGVLKQWLSPLTRRRAGLAFAIGVPLLMTAVMLRVGRDEQARYAVTGPGDPDSAATVDTLSWVAANAPADATIAFFKPRAFRLLSGRLAYAVNQPTSLGTVDWYVFNDGTTDVRTQVDERALIDPVGGFQMVHERLPYRVYARVAAAGPVADSQTSRERGAE